jgi:hypothetical protein
MESTKFGEAWIYYAAIPIKQLKVNGLVAGLYIATYLHQPTFFI